jgi:hypothetical protein
MSKNILLPQDLQEFAELFEEVFPSHDFNWKPYPNRWMGLCPFHEENHHSFNIFYAPDGTLAYRCFACGKSGTVYGILKQYTEFWEDTHEQKQQVKKKSEDWKLRELAEEFVKDAKEHLLKALEQDSVETYHLKRKIIPQNCRLSLRESIEFYGIGLITESLISEWEKRGERYKEFLRKADEKVKILSKAGYMIFPYYSFSGNLISLKLRDISSSSRTSRVLKLFEKKTSAYFGGLGFLRNWLKKTEGWIYPVIVTEGETDALSSFLASGIPALAVGSANNYTFLLEDKLSEFGFFPIIFPDFDPYSLLSMGAGREAIVKLYEERKRRKENEKIYVLVDSEAYRGAKDINEALTIADVKIEEIFERKNIILSIKDAVSKFYEDWQEWKLVRYEQKQKQIEEQLEGLGEVYTDFLSIKKKQEKKELSIDDIEGLQGDMELILGRFPGGKTSVIASFGGVGKTTYAVILAFEIATKENKKVLIWTTEHSPESIKRRIARIKETSELKEFYEKGRDKVFFKVDIPEPLVNAKKEFNSKAFKELRKLVEKYDVIILDPYLTFVEGEENDNVIARKVIKKIHSILSEFGETKAVIFLHHFGKLALREALLDKEDIEEKNGKEIRISREKVEELVKSVRGASAIVDTARYVEAIVLMRESRERYIVTIKTNEDTRQEGYGEKIPELISIQSKKDQLFERVRELVLAQKIFVDDECFEKLEKYGITSYTDFEKFYPKVPLHILENFVSVLEREEEECII